MGKALLKAAEEEQRSAQEQHLALDSSALAESGDRLVYHRLKDAGSNVLLARTLIEQRLDISLGKNAAAGGNRIDSLVLQAQPVHLLGADIQQGCHLVDEGAGTSGTASVHPLLQASGEEDDFRILAAQLDDRIGVRLILHDCFVGGKDLLHKINAGILCQTQSGRTGNRRVKRFSL